MLFKMNKDVHVAGEQSGADQFRKDGGTMRETSVEQALALSEPRMWTARRLLASPRNELNCLYRIIVT